MHGTAEMLMVIILYVGCNRPPSPTGGGTFQPFANVYDAGAFVTYFCITGILVGSMNNTCNADGTWSQPAPMCNDNCA